MSAPAKNHVPPPFHFAFRFDLMEELCADDLFRRRPADETEALRMGRHFGSKFFNPKDPMNSIEACISKYAGPRSRYLIFARRFRGEPNLLYTLQTSPNARTGIERYGLLDDLFLRAEAFVSSRGLNPATSPLYPPPLPADGTPTVGTWALGYEAGTGNCAIIDSGAGKDGAPAFVRGENIFATPNFSPTGAAR